MASVYKKRREARGALLEREVLLRQVRCSLLRPPPLPSDFRSLLRISGEQARRWNTIYSLSLSLSLESDEETRDNSPPPPLSTYSYENVEHDFVFTDPTFDENPVWETEGGMDGEEWQRDEVVGFLERRMRLVDKLVG